MANIELLKDAYAILDGIPEKVIDLEKVVSKKAGKVCNSVACGAGWLAMHPQFKALGLKLIPRTLWGYSTHSHDVEYDGEAGIDSMAKLFGVTEDEADRMFSMRHHYDDELGNSDLTDKQILLQRIREVIGDYS